MTITMMQEEGEKSYMKSRYFCRSNRDKESPVTVPGFPPSIVITIFKIVKSKALVSSHSPISLKNVTLVQFRSCTTSCNNCLLMTYQNPEAYNSEDGKNFRDIFLR